MHSTVDVQCGAGDVTSAIGCKKRHARRDLPALAEATERYALEQRLTLLFVESSRHVGIDEPRRHTINRDPTAADLASERFAEADQPGLRCGVIALTRISDRSD